jgi:hypothetical protein
MGRQKYKNFNTKIYPLFRLKFFNTQEVIFYSAKKRFSLTRKQTSE